VKRSVRLLAAGVLALSALALGCRDLGRWSTGADHYEGAIIAAEFVRRGMPDDTRLCLTLDTNHLDDAPGTITTSDGRFSRAPLVPMTVLAHDPLSTLSFGSGRTKNLLYAARASTDAGAVDLVAVVSLMDSGAVEVRLLHPGALPEVGDGGDAGAPPGLFAVWSLERRTGPCPFGPSA